MRCLLALACCLSLGAADIAQLHQLQEHNLIFQLRDALQQPGWNDSETLFYRAIIQARFGQETAAITDLRTFLAGHPENELERKADEELGAALVRLGRYGEAASALAKALRRTPRHDKQRADNDNSRALYEALRDTPPQTVQFGQETTLEAKHNPIGSWDVPVEVNGRRGEWIFDSGANLSTLAESEAARLGLSPRQTSTYVNGSTGKKNALRLAVARDLRFGNAHLSNVVFLVISDQALYIGPVKYQIRGILGLPVLRALGSVGIAANGAIRIQPQAAAFGEPNMFLDEQRPIIDTRHAGHRLQMFLDTGANQSTAYPSMREAFARDELGKLTRKHDETGGAGGTVTRTIEVVPTLRFEILGRAVDLTNLTLLLQRPPGKDSHYDGVLGMDALAGGFTLDFGAMQLRLD